MGYNRRRRDKERGRGGSGNRRQRGRAVPITTVSSLRPLEINEETRWKPRSLTASNEEESEESRQARLVLLLLNKLTPQNFDKIVTDFVAQTTMHESNERTRNAIDSIVERASLDMRYSQVYAQLCQRLASDLCGESCISFREALLNHCRENLNPLTNSTTAYPQEDLFEHPEERKVRLALARRRYVGSKRLVGELHNNSVFQMAEVLSFVKILLNRAVSTAPESKEIDELALEGLCVVLDACGKTLDETAVDESLECWKAIEGIVCEQESDERRLLSVRMKYMVLDLLELRESGWSSMRYRSRQRKELIAKPLIESRNETANGSRKSKRGGNKKGKTVSFQPKSAP